MSRTAPEIIVTGLQLLPPALAPYVEDRLARHLGTRWRDVLHPDLAEKASDGSIKWEPLGLFKTMIRYWSQVFASELGRAEHSHVHELRDLRNRWAHFEPLDMSDAERALDTMRRLMAAIGAHDVEARLQSMRDAVLSTIVSAPVETEGAPAAAPGRAAVSRARAPAAAATQADAIRAFVMTNYADPARADGRLGFHVRAGDVHRAMGLSQALPNVCSALEARKFSDAAGVRLENRVGPRRGATVTYHFAFVPPRADYKR